MNIFQRTLLIAMFPTFFAIALGAYVINEKHKNASNLIELEKTFEFAPLLSNVVHELQRERGLSAGELGRSSSGENQKLNEQKIRTGDALIALKSTLEREDLQLPIGIHTGISKVAEQFGELQSVREQVLARSIKLPDMAKYYTSRIQTILKELDTLTKNWDASSRTNTKALMALMNAKEKMGLERAMGANGFGKAKFDHQVYLNFVSFIAQQNTLLNIFRQNASDHHIAMLDEKLSSEQLTEFRELRELALANGLEGELRGVTTIQWFEAITLLIEELKVLEDDISGTLQVRASNMSNEARSFANTVTIVLLAFVFGSVIYSVFVARKKIVKPIQELAGVCEALSNDQQVCVPFQKVKDEIGDLSRSINCINRTSISRKRIRAALQSANAQLMIVANGQIKFVQPKLEGLLIDASSDTDMSKKLMRGQPLKNLPAISDAISNCDLKAGSGLIESFKFGDRVFDLLIAVAKDIDGEDLGVVVEWRDVTERRQIESKISELIEDATNGNFGNRIEFSTDDETLGKMAMGINAVCATVDGFINDLSASLNALAIGDLTRPVTGNYSGQLDDTSNDANATISSLTNLIDVISGSAQALDAYAVQLKDDSAQLASRTESQAAVLQETNATMQDIASNVVETATNAKETKQLIADTKDKIDGCDMVVRDTVRAIQQIEQSSAAISEITEIIQSISFQTNLLALNAAVEAARAGSAGAGFAVVASEVRALAKRSSEAASDIDTRIKSSEVQVEKGVNLVHQAGRSLSEIQEDIVKVVDTISLITNANQDQTTGIKSVQHSVDEIDKVTQHNASVAVKSAQAARIIAEKSRELTEQTGRFEIHKPEEHHDAA